MIEHDACLVYCIGIACAAALQLDICYELGKDAGIRLDLQLSGIHKSTADLDHRQQIVLYGLFIVVPELDVVDHL